MKSKFTILFFLWKIAVFTIFYVSEHLIFYTVFNQNNFSSLMTTCHSY